MDTNKRLEKLEAAAGPKAKPPVMVICNPFWGNAPYTVQGVSYESEDAVQAAYPGHMLIIINLTYGEPEDEQEFL